MYSAEKVQELLLNEKSRTAEAFEHYQKMARLVRDLDNENTELRKRLYSRSWIVRYVQMINWARQPQPKMKQESQKLPGIGLDVLVIALFVVTGLASVIV